MVRVHFEEEMLAKLDECDKWLNGKDEALAEVERCEKALEEAKRNAEEYVDENIAEVEAYRNELESKLVALGVLHPVEKEEVVEEKVEEEVCEEAQPVEQDNAVQEFLNTIVVPEM